jgi:hypothetical protein
MNYQFVEDRVVGQVDNLRTDCQSVQPGNARPERSHPLFGGGCARPRLSVFIRGHDSFLLCPFSQSFF